MLSFVSNAVTSFGPKQHTAEPSRIALESSDDECWSNAGNEEGLECLICLESFNIVENVPYVLWCGHTLCKNCVLMLQRAVVKFSSHQIQIPFFIACPWCNSLTLRLIRKGNIKSPRKNFFLFWMVESLSGNRVRNPSSFYGDHQTLWSPRSNSVFANNFSNHNLRRTHAPGQLRSNSTGRSSVSSNHNVERPHLTLKRSLDFFIHFTAKFPFVVLLLLIVVFAIPASAAILALYLLITILFALPSVLILYFASPALGWLVREITT